MEDLVYEYEMVKLNGKVMEPSNSEFYIGSYVLFHTKYLGFGQIDGKIYYKLQILMLSPY